MSGTLHDNSGERGTTAAQVGKLLCVSETIFPAASRHSMHLVYRGISAGGALQPTPQSGLAGSEFACMRGPAPPRPGADAAVVTKPRPHGTAP
jgi:hypothetical protein